MKKVFAIVIVAIVIIALLTACSSYGGAPIQNPRTLPAQGGPVAPQPSQGITVNEIGFEIVKPENLTSEKQDILEKIKRNKGFIYWEEDSDFYIAIFAGQKPTAGYKLEVKSIEDNEGKTNILIDVTAPQDFAAEVITYPYIVIKTAGIADNFNIEDMQGEAYKMIYVK